jgi:hypothetical protein
MSFGQADQAADFVPEIFADVLFGQLRAELFIVRTRRVVDDIVPPDRLGQDFALGRRKAVTRASAPRQSSICARL